LSRTFLIRSAAKSCWASAMPRSKASAVASDQAALEPEERNASNTTGLPSAPGMPDA